MRGEGLGSRVEGGRVGFDLGGPDLFTQARDHDGPQSAAEGACHHGILLLVGPGGRFVGQGVGCRV